MALSCQVPQQRPVAPLVVAVRPAQPPPLQQHQQSDSQSTVSPVPGGSRQFMMPVPPPVPRPVPLFPGTPSPVRRAIFTSSPLSSSPTLSPASSTSTLAVPLPASPSSGQDMFEESL
jgi:hypothetical protein